MHLEVMVEEHSMEVTLQNLIPKMVPHGTPFRIVEFSGKQNLLKQLPNRLRGYASWVPDDYRFIVLIDEDRQDCHRLKNELENICQQVGMTTKTHNNGSGFQILNRIVVEELESWFIGDVEALQKAFPRVPPSFANWKKFRDPDTVPGGTWETLGLNLQRLGYFEGGYAKVKAAREISPFMNPERNRSKSFQVFRDGLIALQLSCE